jgi:hypothetical protein
MLPRGMRIFLPVLLIGLLFTNNGLADGPKFYSLGGLADSTTGGFSYWLGTPPPGHSKEVHTFTVPGEKTADRIDCNNRAPADQWYKQAQKIRDKLHEYQQWLDDRYRYESDLKRQYKADYDNAVAQGDSKGQNVALDNLKNADQGCENIKQQQDDTDRRLQALEKQRAEQASQIQQQCGDQSSGCKQNSGWLCM